MTSPSTYSVTQVPQLPCAHPSSMSTPASCSTLRAVTPAGTMSVRSDQTSQISNGSDVNVTPWICASPVGLSRAGPMRPDQSQAGGPSCITLEKRGDGRGVFSRFGSNARLSNGGLQPFADTEQGPKAERTFGRKRRVEPGVAVGTLDAGNHQHDCGHGRRQIADHMDVLDGFPFPA